MLLLVKLQSFLRNLFASRRADTDPAETLE
jgi:hypothetical protein